MQFEFTEVDDTPVVATTVTRIQVASRLTPPSVSLAAAPSNPKWTSFRTLLSVIPSSSILTRIRLEVRSTYEP